MTTFQFVCFSLVGAMEPSAFDVTSALASTEISAAYRLIFVMPSLRGLAGRQKMIIV